MSKEPEFDVYAEICFHYRDRKFADGIAKYLQRFRLPSHLRKLHPRLPEKFSTIRQTENGVIRSGTEREAIRAKFLIVICSIHSVDENGNSELNDIIENHLQFNGNNSETIIPVINRSRTGVRATRCLPSAVSSRSLLAADIADKGLERVLSDIASKMLDLDPDVLWNRRLREMKRKRLINIGGCSLILLVSALATQRAYNYYAPHRYFYEEFVELYNKPVGLHELSEESCMHRTHYYEFTVRKGLVERVEQKNGHGYAPLDYPKVRFHPHRSWSAAAKYTYNENGDVTRCDHFDTAGRHIAVRSFEDDTTYFKSYRGQVRGDDDPTIRELFFDMHVTPNGYDRPASIAAVQQERDEVGRVVLVRYLDSAGNPTRSLTDEWGLRYVYDNEGNVVSCLTLDHNNQIKENAQHIAGQQMKYDEMGRMVSIAFVDKAGQVVEVDGVATMAYTYDVHGNLASTARINKDGVPANGSVGFHKETFSYNHQGDCTDISFWGADSSRVYAPSGVATIKRSYDNKGRIISLQSYGLDGQPIQGTQGSFMLKQVYDEQNNLIESTNHGIDGKPILYNGVYKVLSQYNERGQLVSEFYYGIKDEPAMNNKTGSHGVKCTYDEQGFLLEVAHYDPRLPDRPAMKIVYKRHASSGARLEETTYDLHGAYCNNPVSGCSRSVTKWNDAGQLIELRLYSATAQKTLWFSRGVRYEYDKRGRKIKEMQITDDGNIAVSVQGQVHSGIAYQYNEQDELICQTFLDAHEKPCYSQPGVMSVHVRYNNDGKMAGELYTDAEGYPVLKDGYSSMLYDYDKHGELCKRAYYGLFGEPTNNLAGVHCLTVLRNEQGKEIEFKYTDAQGNLTNGPEGYALIKMLYDEHGRRIAREVYNKEMKRVR